MSAAVQFFKDVLADLKSSRRFQVATLLWVPLFVVLMIAIVRFGIQNTMAEKYKEWKLTFVPESTIQFPNLLLGSANPNGFNKVPVCQQESQPTTVTWVTSQTNCPVPWLSNCWNLNFAHYSSAGVDAYSYAVRCTFVFNPAPQSNDMLYLWVPGGFGSASNNNWNEQDVPIRANNFVAVHLQPEYFFPMHEPSIKTWSTDVQYWTSVFGDTSQNVYNSTIWFRIPYTMVTASWETVGFDRWFLIAFWGGAIVFFWFLHSVAFGIAKYFLPDDSKLLPGSSSSGAFQSIA